VQHGSFALAKAAAYSAILTLFPAFIVIAWAVSQTAAGTSYAKEIAYAVSIVMPPTSRTVAMTYFQARHARSLREVYSAGSVMVFAATGVMISWMEGFRRAYLYPKNPWGFWHERFKALLLVVLSFAPMAFATVLVAFGNQIELTVASYLGRVIGPVVLLVWMLLRWLIAAVTSVLVISLIYHWGVPRVQPFRRVLPGAALATALWFPVTLLFGWYVTTYSNYNMIYGPLAASIAVLVWLYIISVIIMVGAEYNAQAFPRGKGAPE
jgi:membrane protein